MPYHTIIVHSVYVSGLVSSPPPPCHMYGLSSAYVERPSPTNFHSFQQEVWAANLSICFSRHSPIVVSGYHGGLPCLTGRRRYHVEQCSIKQLLLSMLHDVAAALSHTRMRYVRIIIIILPHSKPTRSLRAFILQIYHTPYMYVGR